MKDKKKKSKIEELMQEFNQLLVTGITIFDEAIHFLADDNFAEFDKKVEEIIAVEKKGDRLKDDLISEFIKRETMAFSRADRIDLIEAIDNVHDRIEYCARTIKTHHIKSYEPVSTHFKKYSNDLAEVIKTLSGAVEIAEEDLEKTIEATRLVESLRRSARNHSFEIMDAIVQYKFEATEKILLYNTVTNLLKILDEAEQTSDFLRKIAIKYLVVG